MAQGRVTGFSKGQRRWILERDGYQCSFMTYDAAKKEWVRCSNKQKLQVHHVTPRGFYSHHLQGCGWEVNSPENGITLCAFHHTGEGATDEQKPYVIHWDVRTAKIAYRRKWKTNPFEKMKENRVFLNTQQGRPYWNTRWDWLFDLIVRVRNKRFKGRSFPMQKDSSPLQNGTKGKFFKID